MKTRNTMGSKRENDTAGNGQTEENLEAVVLQAVKDCCWGAETEEKTHSGSLLEADLHLDSLDQLEIIMAIEIKLQISIPNDQLDNIRTVQDLINVTQRTLSNAN